MAIAVQEVTGSGPFPELLLPIASIRLDGGTQMRAAEHPETVQAYAEAMREGIEFPPIVVFVDEEGNHWLADGFQRHSAAVEVGFEEIRAEIRSGTRREAVLFSVAANATHGLPRTNADKRKAVRTLLEDEEWRGWSDREIARRAAVGPDLVGSVRQELSVGDRQIGSEVSAPTVRKVSRNGKTFPMNTGRIGKAEDKPPKGVSTDTEAATSANGGEPSDELTALKEKAEKARQSVLKAARRYYAAKKSVPIPMSDTKKQMERSIEGRAEFARLKHEESKARDWLLTTIYRMAEAEARVTGRTIVKCLDTYEEFKAAIEKDGGTSDQEAQECSE